jgi:hypothetical protein
MTASPGYAADTATVTGKVVFKGKPIGTGKIVFHPPVGKAIAAKINKDGTYEAKNVPVGKLMVSVDSKGLPKKYTSPKTSGLTYEPAKGANQFDIELQ